MTSNKRLLGFLFLGGALVALVLLSASLSNLQLRSGLPFPGSANSNPNFSSFTDKTAVFSIDLSFIRGILALLFLLLMFYVSVRLITLISLKRIFQWLIVMIGLLILINLFSRITPGSSVYFSTEEPAATTVPTVNSPVSPLGEPPQTFIWLVLIGLVIGAALLVVVIFKNQRSVTRKADPISSEATVAIQDIRLGKDLRSVIIRCYLQMTRAIEKERKIERNQNMTVREFEDWLEFKGFPPKPVQQLTGLFEKARYDSQPMLKDDEKLAVESLNEIIQFCQSAGNGLNG